MKACVRSLFALLIYEIIKQAFGYKMHLMGIPFFISTEKL